MSKLAKNTAIYAIGDIIPKLLNLITFPIMTSNLSAGDFGVINYINSIEAFLTIVTFLGLKTYYLVHYYKMDNEEEQKKLLGNLTIFILGFNLILTVILTLIGQPLFKSLGSGEVGFFPYIFIGIITNFFSILSVLPSALYRVRENPLPLTIINAVKGFLIMVLTWVWVVREPSALTVLNIKLIVSVIFGVFFLYITFRNSILRFNWKQLKLALAFSLPLVPGDVAYYLSSMSDRILIERYLSVEVLGIYSVAATLAGMLNILGYGAYKAFEPYFFKTYGKPTFVDSFEKVRNILLYILLILALCLTAFSKEFVQIFAKPEYGESYVYVLPLALGVVINTLSIMYATILTAQSRTKVCAAISMLCAAVSVVLNVLLLPRIGVWSSAIATITINLLTYVLAKRISNVKTTNKSLLMLIVVFLLFSISSVFINIDNLGLSLIVKTALVALFILLASSICKLYPLQLMRAICTRPLLLGQKSQTG